MIASYIRIYRNRYTNTLSLFKYVSIPLFSICGYCITRPKNIYAISQVTDKRPINNPIQGRCY